MSLHLKDFLGLFKPGVVDLAELPKEPGAYILFDELGNFHYVGKAHDLQVIVKPHFTDEEQNPFIKGQVHYFIAFPTETVDQAETLEGYYFDKFCELAGNYPPANRQRPPKSSLSDEKKAGLSFRRFMAMFEDRPTFKKEG